MKSFSRHVQIHFDFLYIKRIVIFTQLIIQKAESSQYILHIASRFFRFVSCGNKKPQK